MFSKFLTAFSGFVLYHAKQERQNNPMPLNVFLRFQDIDISEIKTRIKKIKSNVTVISTPFSRNRHY